MPPGRRHDKGPTAGSAARRARGRTGTGPSSDLPAASLRPSDDGARSRIPRAGDDWTCCPRCGGRLASTPRSDIPRPTCRACGFVFFANPGVGAAAVIRDTAGRVLLVQRAPGQFAAGKWCFPCGFVEWGEDVRVAAAREAHEEAGVRVHVGEVMQVASNFHDPDKPTVGVWFDATLLDPGATPVAGDDAVAARWFDARRPPPLAFPTDATLLARLATGRRRSASRR